MHPPRITGPQMVSLIAVALLWAVPPAHGQGIASSLQQSFQSFCAEWMKKLDLRERRNRERARAVENGDGVMLEYTGYGERPLRCEARPSDGTNGIGRLVYHELRLRAAGSTLDGARSERPRVVRRIEVMEIFRFDGGRWVY